MTARRALLLSLLLAAAARADPADSLTIGRTTFTRVAAIEDESYSLVEYIPAGEWVDAWRTCASVKRVKAWSGGAADYIAAVAQRLRAESPAPTFEVRRNPGTHRLLIEYIQMAPDGSWLDWNAIEAGEIADAAICSHQLLVRRLTRRFRNPSKETIQGIWTARAGYLRTFTDSAFALDRFPLAGE